MRVGARHCVVLCVCQCVMLLTIGNINPSVTVPRDHERDLSSTQARYNIHSVFQSLSKVCIDVRLRVSVRSQSHVTGCVLLRHNRQYGQSVGNETTKQN